MTTKKWKSTIVRQMKALNVYDKSYTSVIDTLSNILEQRDNVYQLFLEQGQASTIEYTNKGGATNIVKNPLLILWDDLNKSALQYWRELGLTPQSLKKITGGKPLEEKKKGLAAALAELD